MEIFFVVTVFLLGFFSCLSVVMYKRHFPHGIRAEWKECVREVEEERREWEK